MQLLRVFDSEVNPRTPMGDLFFVGHNEYNNYDLMYKDTNTDTIPLQIYVFIKYKSLIFHLNSTGYEATTQVTQWCNGNLPIFLGGINASSIPFNSIENSSHASCSKQDMHKCNSTTIGVAVFHSIQYNTEV